MNSYEIGPARPDEAARCPEIEARAAVRFAPEDLPPSVASQVTDLEELVVAQREGRLLVARVDEGETPVGFVLLEDHGEEAHLAEVDVLPEYGGAGIGRDLVEAACAWARIKGFATITLSTFRDVAWNAPFYARVGFEALP
ncbi:MAG: GNAT family N-acetyltransferase, partial [Myxococcota bacterium]